MTCHYLLLCLSGILLSYFAITSVAHESIIGGQRAGISQFPYQVSLQIPGHGHACGGGIINEKFILTAAHCVVAPNGRFRNQPLYTLAGTNDLRRLRQRAIVIKVDKIYVPAEFTANSISSTGDIAVLRLAKPLRLLRNPYLMRLEFPTDKRDTYAGQEAIFAGFGQYKTNLPPKTIQVSDQLLYAQADILNNHECQQGYKLQVISDKHICARIIQTRGTRGACNADSGGPLVHGHTVVGVLSRGPTGCTEKLRASVYTRVSSFMDFIHEAMMDKDVRSIRSFNLH